MSDADPTLKDIWRLLGTMNKRFDGLEREMASLRTEVKVELAAFRQELADQKAELRSQMQQGFGALRTMIEARDFRLDEHGRRITDLETART